MTDEQEALLREVLNRISTKVTENTGEPVIYIRCDCDKEVRVKSRLWQNGKGEHMGEVLMSHAEVEPVVSVLVKQGMATIPVNLSIHLIGKFRAKLREAEKQDCADWWYTISMAIKDI